MRANFPIRLKILVTLLVIVTVVVSAITFTMARLFHQDKQTYITDLVSMVSINSADEARALLAGYQERARAFAHVLADTAIAVERRRNLANNMLTDFPELMSITVHAVPEVRASVYDPEVLGPGGGDPLAFVRQQRKQPLPLDQIAAGRTHIENVALADGRRCLLLAMPHVEAGDTTRLVIEAAIGLDALIRLTSRSEVFDVSLWDGRGYLLAHRDSSRVHQHGQMTASASLDAVRKGGTTNITHELTASSTDLVEGIADAGFGGVIATARIPRSTAFLASRELLRILIVVALLLLVLAAVFGVYGAHQVTKHLEGFVAAAKRIGRGEFGARVEVESRDEIASLAESFNEMAAELNRREQALDAAHAALVQSEKMAAFGQLGAGIAHEVKNPLAGILACAQLSLRIADPSTPMRENIEMIEKETRRCKSIIDNLLRFARQEKALFDYIDANSAVADAVGIVRHQMELGGFKMHVDLAPELPTIRGNTNQLEQVLINLLMNAQQATGEGGGDVWLSTSSTQDAVQIRVRDAGPGIPAEIQQRIFEPFFTTKPTGKGTGLGLSVTYGIIKDHNGTIEVNSAPGAGAEFVITLPVATPIQAQQAA